MYDNFKCSIIFNKKKVNLFDKIKQISIILPQTESSVFSFLSNLADIFLLQWYSSPFYSPSHYCAQFYECELFYLWFRFSNLFEECSLPSSCSPTLWYRPAADLLYLKFSTSFDPILCFWIQPEAHSSPASSPAGIVKLSAQRLNLFFMIYKLSLELHI